MKKFRDTIYYISISGDVINSNSGKKLKPYYDSDGYLNIVIMLSSGKRKRFSVHRLVAITYLGDLKNLTVNHKNGVKDDNNVDNLEWCTVEENNLHAKNTGLLLDGLNNPISNIGEEQLLTLYTLCLSGKKDREELSEIFKISKTGLSRIFCGKSFKRHYDLLVTKELFDLFIDRKRSEFKQSLKPRQVERILDMVEVGWTINRISGITRLSAKIIKKVVQRYNQESRIDILYT